MNATWAAAPQAAAARAPVLCVEDHPVNIQLMQALFERLPGERLWVATSVAEGLALMRRLEGRCALLLLDIGLPDGRGSDLLGHLRQLPTCAATYAVAVTAEHGFDFATHGFDELWEKPLDLPRVLERLRSLLSVRTAAPLHERRRVGGTLT